MARFDGICALLIYVLAVIGECQFYEEPEITAISALTSFVEELYAWTCRFESTLYFVNLPN